MSVCVCVCVCVCVRWGGGGIFFFFFFHLYVKALLQALSYRIIRFNSNVMDVVNVIIFYLVLSSDTTNEFLPGGNKDILY